MPTLDEWYDQVLQRQWSRVRVSTRDRRELEYRRLRDTLGRKRLDQLTVPVIHTWLHDLIDRDGNRQCVQAAHETLEAMLAVAVAHRLLPGEHREDGPLPRRADRPASRMFLSYDQYRDLLTACQDVGERTLVRVLRQAGLRRSEAIARDRRELDYRRLAPTIGKRRLDQLTVPAIHT